MQGQYDDQQMQDPYDAEQMNSQQGDQSSVGLPETLYLMQFCAQAFAPTADTEEAKAEAERSWELVREWLHTHSPAEIRVAAEQRDDVGKTALHFACQNCPPIDIVEAFLHVADEIVQWSDSFGWLPIHYACAYDAAPEVIKTLAEAYPESKTTVDRKRRTPLHFFLGTLGTQNSNAPDVVVLLSNTGAASYKTDEGLLPLHLACAFGRSEETLYVLTDAYPEGVTAVDSKQRTPLHFVLSNASRKSAPAAARLLLGLKPELVNSVGGGPLPLLVLAQFSSTGIDKSNEQQLDAVQGCLKHILASHPKPTPEFFSALQRLPTFLRERAVVITSVQKMLNDKISERFTTMILILDLYMQFLVLITYVFGVTESQRLRRLSDDPEQVGFLYESTLHHYSPFERFLVMGGLYLGAFYFVLREVLQVVSLAFLGALKIYVRDRSTWLNAVYLVLVVAWTTLVLLGEGDFTVFVYGTSLSVFVLVIKFLSYLRNVYIDFAIFSGGVQHVLGRLGAFLFCLVIFLVAFSRFFTTLFQESSYCNTKPPVYQSEMFNETLRHQLMNDIQCGAYEPRPWCNDWSAILSVYTMLLGEVDETKFIDDEVGPLAVVMFALFMFLIVILLANVLIAIVTDSYKVIQLQRAAIVFWTNRLDFIAQMDAVANGPWKRKVRKLLGLSTRKKNEETQKNMFGEEAWRALMDTLFDDERDEVFLPALLLFRVIVAFLIIPIWFLLGIVTFGILWPPQIRAFFFTAKVTKATETDREDALRKTQIETLHVSIAELKNDLLKELAKDRTQVYQLRSSVAEKKIEIQNEMKHIKRVVTMLFEQQADAVYAT
eukprot:scaffold3211_cov120-Cylindrotheca_fusiformis.AAC.3